jgi:hypothetical protein
MIKTRQSFQVIQGLGRELRTPVAENDGLGVDLKKKNHMLVCWHQPNDLFHALWSC